MEPTPGQEKSVDSGPSKIQPYHRPNLNWVCTNEDGCGCISGPTPQGTCPQQAPCIPIKNEGAWHCNRAESRGGKCEEGPSPDGTCCQKSTGCVPARSLRAKRAVFVWSCVALTIGVLLIGIWKPNRSEFFAPGDLSTSHSQIWSSGNGEDRCAACHAAAETNPVSWLVDAVTGGTHIGQPQYEKCLTCHQDSLGSQSALMVHNIPRDDLHALTAKHKPVNSRFNRTSVLATPVNHHGEIACANCHREHHGKEHDLTAMTNAQCQNCHQDQFKSFESGHPEFKNLFPKRRTRIAFDHDSHKSRYFQEARKEFDCKSCHEGDEFGVTMQTKSFEASCAECHQEKVNASLTESVPVFSLPLIDVETFKSKGLKIGEWPEDVSFGFDGGIPPLMKVLLSSDQRAVEAMRTLGRDFDLLDLDVDNPQELEAAQKLVLATKALLFDLSIDGQNGIQRRLMSISGNSLDKASLRDMVAHLSADTFTEAQKHWFPNLGSEKQLIQSPPEKTTPPTRSEIASHVFNELHRTRSVVRQVSFQEEDDSTLVENPLDKLLDQAPRSSSTSGTFIQLPSLDSSLQETPVGQKSKPAEIRRSTSKGKSRVVDNPYVKPKQDKEEVRIEPAKKIITIKDDDLLLVNPLPKLLSSRDGKTLANTQSAKDPASTGNEKNLAGASDQKLPIHQAEQNNSKLPRKNQPSIERQPPSERVAHGGWFRNDETYSISFRQTGHADQFTAEWYRFVLALPDSLQNPTTADFASRAIDPNSQGLCASCHSVDRVESSKNLLIHWKSDRRDISLRGFTRFSHRPHLVQHSGSTCTSCHQIQTGATVMKNYEKFSPYECTNGFHSITKSNCTQCHNDQSQIQNCTQCHNYHVGSKHDFR